MSKIITVKAAKAVLENLRQLTPATPKSASKNLKLEGQPADEKSDSPPKVQHSQPSVINRE